jgi:hypothetical protein
MFGPSAAVDEVKRLLPAQAQDDFQATIALTRSYLLTDVAVADGHRDLILSYVSGLWAASSYRQRQSTLSRNAALTIVADANRSIAELRAAGADRGAMEIKERLVQAGFLPGLS